MPVSVTIHDVPDETHDVLAARAARPGQSLQDYLRGELTALASQPSPDEFWDRVRARIRTTGTRLTAAEILAAKDADRA